MNARNSKGFGVVERAAAETAALRRPPNDLGHTPSICAAAGNCTTMRGAHEQSRQSTAMEPGRRRDPDEGVARIKSSGQRAVDLHFIVPVADEVGLFANHKLHPQIIRTGIVGRVRGIVAPGIYIL